MGVWSIVKDSVDVNLIPNAEFEALLSHMDEEEVKELVEGLRQRAQQNKTRDYYVDMAMKIAILTLTK